MNDGCHLNDGYFCSNGLLVYCILSQPLLTITPSLCLFASDLLISLQQYWTLSYRPSRVAAACLYLSRCTLGARPTWTPKLQHSSGYSAADLVPVVHMISAFHRAAGNPGQSPLTAVQKKYAEERFSQVSKVYSRPPGEAQLLQLQQ